MVLVLSYVSGWQTLAKSYEANTPPRGMRFTWQSGSVGFLSYRNCVTVHVAPDGLFLAVPFFFRPGHKPLFLPSSAITNQKPVKILWYEAVSFQVGDPPVELRLSRRIFEARKTGAASDLNRI